MCRIFGFRSIIESQVHRSLVHAENALGIQSQRHPDGWGVAYYVNNSPHVIKSEQSAIDDRLFKHVSGLVSSQTVVAHIRRATQGNKNVLNTHPFQYGPWIFAHNGHIKNFNHVKDEIRKDISPHLAKFILGDTDSEIIFYFLLSEIDKRIGLNSTLVNIDSFVETVKSAIQKLINLIGPLDVDDQEIFPNHNYLTFILTDGYKMIAHQGGQPLHYSTYKKSCGDHKTCPAFSNSCINESPDGYINHLVFSSEPLGGENIWLKMQPYDILGIDEEMKLYKTSLK